ncbi:MAG: CofH family radical SAM protein [Bacteroidales bacterium]|nr:CofH family radical SAM protein [Bacteroidales bacterium]
MNEMFKNIGSIEQGIIEKVYSDEPITIEEGIYLFENSDFSFCAFLADKIRNKKFGKKTFYNKNIHVEISNRCVNKCKFCSFYREKGMPDCWDLEISDVLKILNSKKDEKLTEIHITGGLHPEKITKFYCDLFVEIKIHFPKIHIKAFTAVEIEYFAKKDKMSITDTLKILKDSGLNSLAGGGAEILDDNIRSKICPEKTNSETWLNVHKTAHNLGLSSNCTMLYGHIEKLEDRILHMARIRDLQNITGGFNCFIPLKYKTYGNRLNIENEISLMEELKTYSIARIFLNNIPHIKAYWPMNGKENAALSLSFGVDDMDGTISDSTKIYSMAGSSEQKPEMTEPQMRNLIESHGFQPVERDSEYNQLAVI